MCIWICKYYSPSQTNQNNGITNKRQSKISPPHLSQVTSESRVSLLQQCLPTIWRESVPKYKETLWSLLNDARKCITVWALIWNSSMSDTLILMQCIRKSACIWIWRWHGRIRTLWYNIQVNNKAWAYGKKFLGTSSLAGDMHYFPKFNLKYGWLYQLAHNIKCIIWSIRYYTRVPKLKPKQ